MFKKKPIKPAEVKTQTFADVLAQSKAKIDAEEARFNSMTNEEKLQYLKERNKQQSEINKLLNKLPGVNIFKF